MGIKKKTQKAYLEIKTLIHKRQQEFIPLVLFHRIAHNCLIANWCEFSLNVFKLIESL